MTAPDGTPAPARPEVDGLSEVERERLRLLAGRVDWETTFAVVERIVAAHVEAALAPVRAEVEHWKFHAEEAGHGFAEVCRKHAAATARLSRIESLLNAEIDDHEFRRRMVSLHDGGAS